MLLMSPPATGTVNKSPLVLMASILSVTAVKQISLLSGEKLISPGPPRSSGGTSKSAPEGRSRGAALPSAGRTKKRSGKRRVGEEGRNRGGPDPLKKKKKKSSAARRRQRKTVERKNWARHVSRTTAR